MGGGQRPLSIKEASDRARVSFDPSVSLIMWIRSAELLKRQGDIYAQEGDLEMAFILLLRYANLVVTSFPQHPEYKTVNKGVLAKLRKERAEVLDHLALIKGDLERRYAIWERQLAAKAREREESARRDGSASQEGSSSSSRTRTVYYPAQEDFDLQKEMASLKLSTPSSPPLPPSLEAPPSTRRKRDTYPVIKTTHEPLGSPKTLPSASPATTEPQTTTEGGVSLRLLYVPFDLIDLFLDLAARNTKSGIETAGVLCGKLKQNVLRITTLLIPKQSATSDTCTTMNEEELFEYQDKRKLITLGWIHTHPTQTCFMSSLDLHTQLGYQVMLAESIAIVCAPKHDPDYTIFRLTDPPGVETISKCRDSRSFHPHPQGLAIYTDACDRGHVRFAKAKVETVDLRQR